LRDRGAGWWGGGEKSGEFLSFCGIFWGEGKGFHFAPWRLGEEATVWGERQGEWFGGISGVEGGANLGSVEELVTKGGAMVEQGLGGICWGWGGGIFCRF